MARRARRDGRSRAVEDVVLDDADEREELAAKTESDDDEADEVAADDEPAAEHDAVKEGPFDATDLDMEQTDAVGRLDFGSVRVPMPDEAKLQIEAAPGGRLKAVHILVPLGRLSISALAAPRSAKVWPGLSDEIKKSLRNDGAWVRSETGPWGHEVMAGTEAAHCRFVGVDGPRWMLYGVATGPAAGGAELTEILRDMMRGTIVVRDEQPYPVRTVLPLTAPPHLAAQLEQLQIEDDEAAAQAPVMPNGQPAPPPPSRPPPPVRQRPEHAPPPQAAPPPVRPPRRPPPAPSWVTPESPVTASGRHARYVPEPRGVGVPDARAAEHSNPGAPIPLSTRRPPPPHSGPPPGLAPMPPARPNRPARRPPPRRPTGGVPTPPSWRALEDHPPGSVPAPPPGQRPWDPLFDDLEDQPKHDTDSPSGRHHRYE